MKTSRIEEAIWDLEIQLSDFYDTLRIDWITWRNTIRFWETQGGHDQTLNAVNHVRICLWRKDRILKHNSGYIRVSQNDSNIENWFLLAVCDLIELISWCWRKVIPYSDFRWTIQTMQHCDSLGLCLQITFPQILDPLSLSSHLPSPILFSSISLPSRTMLMNSGTDSATRIIQENWRTDYSLPRRIPNLDLNGLFGDLEMSRRETDTDDRYRESGEDVRSISLRKNGLSCDTTSNKHQLELGFAISIPQADWFFHCNKRFCWSIGCKMIFAIRLDW
jgi:hypothetical protein